MDASLSIALFELGDGGFQVGGDRVSDGSFLLHPGHQFRFAAVNIVTELRLEVLDLFNRHVVHVSVLHSPEGGHLVFNGNRIVLRSEEHTSELQSLTNLVCRLLLEKKKIHQMMYIII